MYTRNGVYYFRRRIPEDLLHHYLPKREFNFSLNTRDYAEAARLQRRSSVTLDDEFHLVRLGINTSDAQPTLLGAFKPSAHPITSISPANVPAQKPNIILKPDTFEALKDYWTTQSPKSRSASAEADTIIKKFRRFVGKLRPSEVTKEHIVTLKDKMLDAGAAPATINKGRSILAAMFSTAVANSKLPSNPCEGMKKLAVPQSEVESPYTIEELQKIFNSPVFTEGYRPEKGKGEAAFWLPLIGLYTGCRLNEGAQLFSEDVGTDNGIPYLKITPDSATGRRVKDSKKRRVPIHPDLVRMGFLEYASKMKQEGHVQLFPELKVTRKSGKLGDKWGSWWSSYIRKDLGMTRIPQPFHAFRHTFVEHGRRCRMDSELRRLIEGHAPNTVEFKHYGNSLYPLEPLYDEIAKLKFTGLDLSHSFNIDKLLLDDHFETNFPESVEINENSRC